jgi:hypothetical protein
MANAAIAVSVGVEEFRDGGLTDATRTQVGGLFVQMYQLQQATLGKLDFNATARAAGKRVLLRRHGAMLSKHYGAAALDAALDESSDSTASYSACSAKAASSSSNSVGFTRWPARLRTYCGSASC